MFDSGIIPREQDFSETVSLIKRKPIIGGFIDKQGLDTVFKISERFGQKDQDTGFSVVRLSALYTAALGVRSVKEVMALDYDELVERRLLQAAILFDYMYNYNAQASEAVTMSQSTFLVSNAPLLRVRATGSARTSSASFRPLPDMYPA